MLPFLRIWRDLGFPEVFGLLGYLPKQKTKFRASLWEEMDGIPEICCLEWSNSSKVEPFLIERRLEGRRWLSLQNICYACVSSDPQHPCRSQAWWNLSVIPELGGGLHSGRFVGLAGQFV